jgi:hypothetical protein
VAKLLRLVYSQHPCRKSLNDHISHSAILSLILYNLALCLRRCPPTSSSAEPESDNHQSHYLWHNWLARSFISLTIFGKMHISLTIFVPSLIIFVHEEPFQFVSIGSSLTIFGNLQPIRNVHCQRCHFPQFLRLCFPCSICLRAPPQVQNWQTADPQGDHPPAEKRGAPVRGTEAPVHYK